MGWLGYTSVVFTYCCTTSSSWKLSDRSVLVIELSQLWPEGVLFFNARFEN